MIKDTNGNQLEVGKTYNYAMPWWGGMRFKVRVEKTEDGNQIRFLHNNVVLHFKHISGVTIFEEVK